MDQAEELTFGCNNDFQDSVCLPLLIRKVWKFQQSTVVTLGFCIIIQNSVNIRQQPVTELWPKTMFSQYGIHTPSWMKNLNFG